MTLIHSQDLVRNVMVKREKGLNSRQISEEMGVSRSTIALALAAGRANKGTINQLQDDYARRRNQGDESFNLYAARLRKIKEILGEEESSLEERTISSRDIDCGEGVKGKSFEFRSRLRECLFEDTLELLEGFPPTLKDMVLSHYIKGESFDDIGRKYGMFRAQVQELVCETLEEVKARYNGVSVRGCDKIAKLPVGDGEAFLAYILSKIPSYDGKVRDSVEIVNELFHNHFRVRSRSAFRKMSLPDRSAPLIEKYFRKKE